MLEEALIHAAATDTPIHLATRIDLNPASGIVRAASELLATDVILGWTESRTTANSFFGTLLEIILQKLNQTIVVVKFEHPFNTVKHIVIALPPNAEAEYGFRHCVAIIRRLSKQIGASVVFWANSQTLSFLEDYKRKSKTEFIFTTRQFEDWRHYSNLFTEITPNTLYGVFLGREHSVSYNPNLEAMPRHLSKTLQDTGYVVLYPGQS